MSNELLQQENETPTLPRVQPQSAGFKHFANVGDVWAAFASVRTFWEVTGRKVDFYQCVNTPGQYYPGAVHPTVDANGTPVTMNDAMFEMVKPMALAQPFINSFQPYAGQQITVDLDVIRGKTNVNMPHGFLAAWIFYAFPDLARDLSKPWIELPDDYHPEGVAEQVRGKVILNFTERYRNRLLDYHFLQGYAPDLIFAGTEKEHWLFCQQFKLNIPRLQINDFKELAYAAKNSRFVMANQSQLWNLCEAMKIPRLLETCMWADNCHAWIGENSHGYYYQTGAEYYFRKMYNTLK